MQLYKIKPQTVNNFIHCHIKITHFKQREMKIMLPLKVNYSQHSNSNIIQSNKIFLIQENPSTFIIKFPRRKKKQPSDGFLKKKVREKLLEAYANMNTLLIHNLNVS